MSSPARRDLVREYVDAFRAQGIRVGFYFSLADWSHPDYPAFRQEDAPYRFPISRPLDPETWPHFVDVMFAQVRELLTHYGEIAVLWFDGQWERTIDQWRAKDLAAMIRELQPNIVLNDRLPGLGDYATPEQFVPARRPNGPWETCMTMNESWAYNPNDDNYKSSRTLIHTLCEVAGKGGNLLLNVGPRGDGTLPPEQVQRLESIAAWISKHSDAIVGTEAALEPWQFYGPATRRGDTLYLHLLMRPYDSVPLRGVRVKRVKSARAVGSGDDLRYHARTPVADMILRNPDPVGELRIDVPASALDDNATIIALEFEEGALP
jgi:alpha-L-fucosidase